ncbi:MAG: TolC family protein [Candidatus Hydrogenedentes bacterium]|nr:TolC family protein [Candidatus Hydrogenedentota bacterium]
MCKGTIATVISILTLVSQTVSGDVSGSVSAPSVAPNADVGAPPAPSGELTLREAAALVLLDSPQLAAFAWDIRAAEARMLQAGLRPNPELAVDLEDIRFERGPETTSRSLGLGTDGIGSFSFSRESGSHRGLTESQLTISLSQLIELGGKRVKRVLAAGRERDVVQWDYEIARLRVLTDAARAFVAVLAAQERFALAGDLVHLAEEVRKTVATRVEAGKVTPLELNRAEIALASENVAHETARRQLEAARVQLAAAWGAKQATFSRVDGHPELAPDCPLLNQLLERLATSPELTRWVHEAARREAALTLAKAQRVPDLTVTLGFRTIGQGDRTQQDFTIGTDGVLAVARGDSDIAADREKLIIVGFSLPLPIFNRNQGNIQEAAHLLSKAEAERRATEVQLHAALTQSYQDMAAAHRELSALRDDILSRAEKVFHSTEEGYRLGKFDYLEVLDAQRTLFNLKSQQVDAHARYHAALAEVERLVGEPIAGDFSALQVKQKDKNNDPPEK